MGKAAWALAVGFQPLLVTGSAAIIQNDQQVINELDIIRKKLSSLGNSMKQFSIEELFAKLERSAKDYENGNYLTVEELESEIKKW